MSKVESSSIHATSLWAWDPTANSGAGGLTRVELSGGAVKNTITDTTPSGTTAERDALYPTPTTRVTWDNTTKGYPEFFDPSDPTGGPDNDGWKQEFAFVSAIQRKLIQAGSAGPGTAEASGYRFEAKDARLFVKLSSTYSAGTVDVQDSVDGVNYAGITGLTGLVATTAKDITTPVRFTRITTTGLTMTSPQNGITEHSSTSGSLHALTGLAQVTMTCTAHGLDDGDYVGFIGALGFFLILSQTVNTFTVLVPADQVAAVEAATLYTHPAALLLAYK